jgi:hypothetical protein
MRKEAIRFLYVEEKKLGRYSHKLSIISKQSKLMQKELRYQVKIQAISDMPKKEKNFLQFLPQFLFIYLFYQTKCYMEMTSYNMQGMIKPV